MSEYIIDIPDEYLLDGDMYYPDERHRPMPLEPIVRCRDCKHSDTLESAPNIVVRCCYRNKLGIPRVVGDDGFCAWAERRDA